jgi:hypothetical protein
MGSAWRSRLLCGWAPRNEGTPAGDLERHPGKRPSDLEATTEGLLWARVIGNTIIAATLKLEMFSELHYQAHELQALQKKYDADISPLEDLLEEYLGALLKFRQYLNQVAKGHFNQLKMAVVASPPMRGFFTWDIPVSASSSEIMVMSKPGVRLDKITEHLVWLLRTLWEEGQNLFLCRLPIVADELERLLEAEQKARELTSPYVARLIGELSIVAECLRQL